MREEDYSELEGMEIIVKYVGPVGLRYERAKVVGCDYDIGITLMSLENEGLYLMCLEGPESPHGKELLSEKEEWEKKQLLESYDKTFRQTVFMIWTGVYDSEALAYSDSGILPSADTCAFT